MRIRLGRILVAALLVAAPLMGAFGVGTAGAWIKGTSWRLTNFDGPANQAEIDGNIIVWRDGRDGTCGNDGSAWNIYMYNLATGQETPVSTENKKQQYPKVSGDIIVYQTEENCDGDGNSDIYMYNVKTGLTSAVTTSTDGEYEPDVSGNYITWYDEYDDIYVYNIATGATSVVCDDSNDQYDPAIDKGVVVWTDQRGSDDDIYMYDIATGTESAVCTATGNQYDPCIGDGVIAWVDYRNGNADIYMYDLATGTESAVETSTEYYYDPEVSGGLLVCEDPDDDITLFDLKSGSEKKLDPTDECEGMPAISGNVVAFNRYDNSIGDPAVWAYTLDGSPTAYNAIAGGNRYDTAVQNCLDCFPDGADTIIIATGENWPDALGASALAGVYDAPILLTYPNFLPLSVRAEIMRLGASDAFIIGETDAISVGVENMLKGMLEGDVTRIGGVHRFETADLVAKQVVAEQGPDFDGTAFLATGGNFPDALAAAPLAAKAGWPIYLSTAEGIAPETQESMDDAGVTRLMILGGYGVVPASVSAQTDVTAERISGANRYATAAAVATWGVENLGLGWNNLALATGENYPDALAAGASQGRRNSVMLLSTCDELHPATATTLITNRTKIGCVSYVGGPNAVSPTVRASVASILP